MEWPKIPNVSKVATDEALETSFFVSAGVAVVGALAAPPIAVLGLAGMGASQCLFWYRRFKSKD